MSSSSSALSPSSSMTYLVKYARWASFLAFSERSGCSQFGSLCSARWMRSLNVQPSRTRYQLRYSGHSRNRKRIGLGHGLAELLERRRPVVRALEDGERLRRRAGSPGRSACARTVADDGHALAGEVDVVGPARGVPLLARPGVEAGDVRLDRRVEQAGGADHHVGLAQLGAAVGVAQLDRPALACRSGRRSASTVGVEADVLAHVELVGHVLEVAVQLVAQAEVLRPVVGGEGERVQVVRRVDAGARVVVLPPHAADGGVALDDLEGDAGRLQVDGRAQARTRRRR